MLKNSTNVMPYAPQTVNNNYMTNAGMGMVQVVDDEIYVNGQSLGVTHRLYDETVDKGLEYKEMLIVAGIIEPELTEAEKMQAVIDRQNEMLARFAETQERLLAKLEAIENGKQLNGQDRSSSGNDSDNGSGGNSGGNTAASERKRSVAGRVSKAGEPDNEQPSVHGDA